VSDDASRAVIGRILAVMTFEPPPPDLTKLVAAWEAFERGEEAPGKVLANLKTAGLPRVLEQLVAEGWTSSAS
jgi:hypothetical protein